MIDSIISIEEGAGLITIRNIDVTINGMKYNSPTAKVRLLSFSEIKRADAIVNSEDPIGKQDLQDDILNTCFIEFIGITDLVDWDEMEAGVAHTIFNAILMKSMSYIINAEEELNVHLNNVNQIDVFHAIISRYLVIPYSETKKLPLNEVYRLYAICKTTFPETELQSAED